MKRNKVLRISLAGGIIGLFATNPRVALENVIEKQNKEGWSVNQIIEHSTNNLIVKVLQLLILIMTFSLWTWGGGYLLILEKEE